VSVNAPLAGGELLTRPTVFLGRELVINYSTSGAGSIRVEIQDPRDTLCPASRWPRRKLMYGDSLEQIVLWKAGSDVSSLAGETGAAAHRTEGCRPVLNSLSE